MYTYMSKLINVANDTYDKLKVMKGEKSFTIVIEGLIEKKEKSNKEAILACAGRGGINKNALKELGKEWKNWSDRYA